MIVAHNRQHLRELVEVEVKTNGAGCCLNHIDVSRVTSFFSLFEELGFNGDISRWDVSNVKTMDFLFYKSLFNGDISQWDVSNVKSMECMFRDSPFNRDISQWDVSNVIDLRGLFASSVFTGDISGWNVSKVENMRGMFMDSIFNGDLSKWDVSRTRTMDQMFEHAAFQRDISMWPVQPGIVLTNMGTSTDFFANQAVTPWILEMYLCNGYTPIVPPLANAFKEVQEFAAALRLTHREHAVAIMERYALLLGRAPREFTIDSSLFTQ